MKLERFEGVWTALATPFNRKGEIDFEGLEKNIEFQIANGAHFIPTGTTGESPTLDWKEHDRVIARTVKLAKGRAFVMAGTGSNSTQEAFRGTKHAVEVGAQGALLVDCYYNGPSSLELRTQYYEVIAKAFRKAFIMPYIIPGRTGTKMEVERSGHPPSQIQECEIRQRSNRRPRADGENQNPPGRRFRYPFRGR